MVREDPVMNARSAPTAPKRVLVADDEHLMATGLAGSLRTLDFEVVGPVASGEEALDIVADEPADLALVDIRMPGIDGLETAHRLWEERGIPSVIISAYSDESYLARAQHPGVFGQVLALLGLVGFGGGQRRADDAAHPVRKPAFEADIDRQAGKDGHGDGGEQRQ
jgi:CheY-like chemotaxis protein